MSTELDVSPELAKKIAIDVILAKGNKRAKIIHNNSKVDVKIARDNIEFHQELKNINDMHCYD